MTMTTKDQTGSLFEAAQRRPTPPAREAIQQILCGMHLDPSGQKVLDDLKFKGFEPIGDEIIPVLQSLAANCDCN